MAEVDSNKPQTEIIIDCSFVTSAKPSQSSILTRLHTGYFQISLSLGSQALLWKMFTSEPKNGSHDACCHMFGKLPSVAFLLLWWLALLTQVSTSLFSILKCFFHFNMVKAEFLHYIGVNFLYVPWISWLLLIQSSTLLDSKTDLYLYLCWVFSIPILMLDIKLYGQWFTTEKKFLSSLANPTSHLSVLANLAVAIGAAQAGYKEGAIFMFSIGMVHYLVLFVTLYQRLSGRNSFPALLRPAFFQFFAVPSMASLAWNSIAGALDISSKMLFFLSLFLFISLACRPALFKKSMRKFTVAWWTYSFPLTFLALASAEYGKQVKGHAAFILMLVLSALSILVFLGLMLLTAINIDSLLRESDPILILVYNSKART